MLLIDRTSFVYIRHTNLFLVAASRNNSNAALLFEYLFQLLRILKSYFTDNFNDESIRSNFTLVFELMDETMDLGYPQNCAIDVLRLYINLGDVLERTMNNTGSVLTGQITGAIDWRREGLKYRNNEVHIDVYEIVTLVTSATGQVMRAEINGKVMMKSQLTGMYVWTSTHL